jgi:hypothetical protein
MGASRRPKPAQSNASAIQVQNTYAPQRMNGLIPNTRDRSFRHQSQRAASEEDCHIFRGKTTRATSHNERQGRHLRRTKRATSNSESNGSNIKLYRQTRTFKRNSTVTNAAPKATINAHPPTAKAMVATLSSTAKPERKRNHTF